MLCVWMYRLLCQALCVRMVILLNCSKSFAIAFQTPPSLLYREGTSTKQKVKLRNRALRWMLMCYAILTLSMSTLIVAINDNQLVACVDIAIACLAVVALQGTTCSSISLNECCIYT